MSVLSPDDLDILLKVRAICGHGAAVRPGKGFAVPPEELMPNCDSLTVRGYLERDQDQTSRGFRLTAKGRGAIPEGAKTPVFLPIPKSEA